MQQSRSLALAMGVSVGFLGAFVPAEARGLVDGELDFSEQTALLADHNLYRSETASGDTPSQPAASDMNALLWDNGLAAVAQGWADQCIWDHNPNAAAQLDAQLTRFTFDPDQVVLGENLYASSASASLATLLAGIEGWHDEHVDYDYAMQSCSGTCGHYTQVVWANTRYVGCGWKLCPNLAGYSNATYLACNYQWAGNYPEEPYTAGTACTQCDGDRTGCDGGLCGGCGSPSWDFCSDWYSNCDQLAAYCPGSCDLSNPDPLCVGCRATCGTCSAEMLEPEAACVDVPIPCSEGCGAFDECLDGATRNALTCDTQTGFCVSQAVSCDPLACLDGACVDVGAVPALGFHGIVGLFGALSAVGLQGLSRRRRRVRAAASGRSIRHRSGSSAD